MNQSIIESSKNINPNILLSVNLDEQSASQIEPLADGLFAATYLNKSNNQQTDDLENINLHELAEVILSRVKRRVKDRPINIINGIDDSIQFKGEAKRINAIFNALTENSLQHGFKRNDSGIIKIEATLSQNKLSITFFDTGRGLKKEQLLKIVEESNRSKGDSQFGLGSVFSNIKQMNGAICFKNNKAEQGLRVDFDIKVIPN